MGKRQPKYEETIDGVRVRLYTSRSAIEALVGDGDIGDPAAEVWEFPKWIGFAPAAAQAALNHKSQT